MTQTMPHVLSEQDVAFFHENGYVVVPNAVPKENLEAALAAVWQFVEVDGMRPDDSSTWYPPQRKSALVHLHQHPALWENRQHERLYQAFADVLGTDALWVSMDRAALKAPIDARFPAYDDRGFVHWDLDTARPLPQTLGVQGVLALTDTSPEMGGFCCVPGFHRVLEGWIAEQPAGRDPRSPDLSRLPDGMAVTPIPMRAGDLVIWDRLLAHGNGRNEGTQPRLAQYITMYPAPSDNDAQRDERIACWRERRAPGNWEKDVPERYRGVEPRLVPTPAPLSPLGQKLLGLERWQ